VAAVEDGPVPQIDDAGQKNVARAHRPRRALLLHGALRTGEQIAQGHRLAGLGRDHLVHAESRRTLGLDQGAPCLVERAAALLQVRSRAVLPTSQSIVTD